jgi:CrcB protein
MIRYVLWVGIGGFLGSVARFLLGHVVSKFYAYSFPLGTFLVNIIGCLIVGIIFGITEKTDTLNVEMRLFLATGFCGGFTTFSTFALENIKLLNDSQYALFAIYSLSSFLIGILAVITGIFLVKTFI